jgi:hypothetical protein
VEIFRKNRPVPRPQQDGDVCTSSRMLKKARLLTRPTLARRDVPFPNQGRSERRPEEVHTALRVGRSPS